jgi:RHH-type proline utilization regulon transcriptional repressor/proline dehydrogenase/delta 1-pyrroline-5-carboxylate dehydrogenase
VPIVVGGEGILDDRPVRESGDPSRPGVVVAQYRQAVDDDVPRAIATAVDDASDWRGMSPELRSRTLYRVAEELADARGDLMGAMLAEGGKTLAESDPEVSEAMDFCRFYADSAEWFSTLDGVSARGKGVVVVVSPWNFPLAIPCGGVAAALAAGNTVILKPASDTVLVAYLLCHCFWQAGVPQTALQFMPCSGGTVGQQLVTHADVAAVILTGGTETARRMLAAKPTINLLAETGGKNATIVTALADRDQAIKNVLHSAFSHGGQKCSATSLLLLEDEVYHDEGFRDVFCDAAESLTVGSAWELPTKIAPLIRPPGGELERGLKELEPGETWAVMPHLHVGGNPHLVSPGVKWGVAPGSFTHCTELFGPMLGVMRFGDLHEAIEIVNSTGFGLTSGLESLDDREHEIWQAGVRAGNLYINRPTTGAIVLRQPFGGMGKSAVGPGIKAGGPNYVVPLMTLAEESRGSRVDGREQTGDVSVALGVLADALRDDDACDANPRERLLTAFESYQHWAAEEFHSSHDHFRLIGEDNLRRYLPVQGLRIRVDPRDTPLEIIARAAAARAVGCLATVSSPRGLSGTVGETVGKLDVWTDPWAGAIEFIEESDEELAHAIHDGRTERVRYAAAERVPAVIRAAAAEALQYVADAPVLLHGRVELLWYVREQSISHVYHRYGNLGRRGDEERTPVL